MFEDPQTSQFSLRSLAVHTQNQESTKPKKKPKKTLFKNSKIPNLFVCLVFSACFANLLMLLLDQAEIVFQPNQNLNLL